MEHITERDLNMDYIDDNSDFSQNNNIEPVIPSVSVNKDNVFNQQNNSKNIFGNNPEPFNRSIDSNTPSSYAGSDLTPEEEERKKKTLLLKLKRLEKRGFEVSRRFTIDSPLEDIQAEVEAIKREAHLEEGTSMAKTGLVFLTTAIEMANHSYDPFDIVLDGWSGQVKEDVDDGKYDEVMEELYDKYYDHIQMAPEVKLLMMVTKSAVEFHVTHTVVKKMFKNNKNVDKVFQQNPNLRSEIMNAVEKTDLKENIYNEIGMKNIDQVREMKEPTDVDDILKELENEDINTQSIKNIQNENKKEDGVVEIDKW
jgi:hypothetical protein